MIPKPNIQIPVDLTNPGQFFACCGLLELADRLWPKSEIAGWFQLRRFDRATFLMQGGEPIDARSVVSSLLGCRRVSVEPYQPIRGSDGKPVKDAEKTRPVYIDSPISLRMSWWLDEIAGTQTPFKTWSANVTSLSLFDDAASAIDSTSVTNDALFASPVAMSGRFGFDTRSSWDTLNTGYSPNDQGQEVETYPVVELLAAVGLQNFRPLPVGDDFHFAPWKQPLPAIVARTAASGLLQLRDTTQYQFTVLSRGKFKSLSKAQLLPRRIHV